MSGRGAHPDCNRYRSSHPSSDIHRTALGRSTNSRTDEDHKPGGNVSLIQSSSEKGPPKQGLTELHSFMPLLRGGAVELAEVEVAVVETPVD